MAKAISVAMGMPHPFDPALPAVTRKNNRAGKTMPTAAIAGIAAVRGSRSSHGRALA